MRPAIQSLIQRLKHEQVVCTDWMLCRLRLHTVEAAFHGRVAVYDPAFVEVVHFLVVGRQAGIEPTLIGY
jgi:hypothetical protein